MKWISDMLSGVRLVEAVPRLVDRARAGLGGEGPDLALLFFSPHHLLDAHRLPDLVQTHLPGCVTAGCSGMGVIGGGAESQQGAAVGLLAGCLPGVAVQPFYSRLRDMPDADASPEAWRGWFGRAEPGSPPIVILADPFAEGIEAFVSGLDYAFPGSAKIGGLSSGGTRPGDHVLLLDDAVFDGGLIALVLDGPVRLDTIVAHGCRPVGRPLTVTACSENVLFEVDGVTSPAGYIEALRASVGLEDRELIDASLYLGLEAESMQPMRDHYVMRNLLGIDRETGSVTVGAMVHEGQVIQFHVRDREASASEVGLQLQSAALPAPLDAGAGALLFSCRSRGEVLYRTADHDSRAFAEHFGDVPLSGFFGNGEIGSVGTTTFVHGNTSAFGILRPA